eukprot:CAMPEP_0172600854 /NCGR_PEP_ID=MMETSP1068-20121228/21009_1 /TAXON_ID=35684 /ORGANISM="Pseudopedinella elastica, Strain CCMP716" /LENGTH=607 /DNA_ID=CAMNT_0013401653 /DNA_START=25 /DNA_END=1851 /DNA_ORIENTATION=+
MIVVAVLLGMGLDVVLQRLTANSPFAAAPAQPAAPLAAQASTSSALRPLGEGAAWPPPPPLPAGAGFAGGGQVVSGGEQVEAHAAPPSGRASAASRAAAGYMDPAAGSQPPASSAYPPYQSGARGLTQGLTPGVTQAPGLRAAGAPYPGPKSAGRKAIPPGRRHYPSKASKAAGGFSSNPVALAGFGAGRPASSASFHPSSKAATGGSPWSWANYTTLPAEDWPVCSALPNCLNFKPAEEHACGKWRQVSNYPVLVGDMDGSGSRGMTWLLRAGGVWMRTTNEWLDWAKDEHPLSNQIMHATHSLDYQFEKLPRETRARAEAQVRGVLKEFASVAQTQMGKWSHRALKPWEKGLDARECPRRVGWKHGPTLFLQPVYQRVTGGRFTFVHLVRDGRDMAFSRNRNNLAKYPKFGGQVVGLFKLGKKNFNHCFFKPNEKHSAESDRECIVMQMRLWERMNLGAAAYGHRELGRRYVPVRVEDFILPDEATRAATILLLFKRLGVDTVSTEARARELSAQIFGSASLRSHFSIERWGGCSPEIIDEVEKAGAEGLFHFGYEKWPVLAARQRELAAQRGGAPLPPNGCSVGSSQIQVPGVTGHGQKKHGQK